MGIFSSISATSKATGIANKVAKVSTEIINLLIRNNVPIKTHDSINIILYVMSGYCFNAIQLTYVNKDRGFKEILIGQIRYMVSDLATKIINPAVGGIVENLHQTFVEPHGPVDENFKEWLISWRDNYSDITTVNFEIEENTTNLILSYLDETHNLNSNLKKDLRTVIFEVLKGA